jgi:hypothetical protein
MSKVIPIIPTWSFSRLSVFEQCKFRAKLAYVDKIPEPERPLPPGKLEHANDRGSRIHDGAEMYVRGKGPFLPEMEKFRPEFEALKRLFDAGKVSLEGEWGTNRNWEPCAWSGPETWQRLKIDALIFLSDYEAVVVDYKSGGKFGKEVTHNEQCQLYQLVTFLRYPKLESITTELWYTDKDELTSHTYTRQQGLRFRSNWDRRGNAMTTATEFPANPNKYSCQWCPYKVGENKTGHCERGV